MNRPVGGNYRHPCPAVTLFPTGSLWTATWLIDHGLALYLAYPADLERMEH